MWVLENTRDRNASAASKRSSERSSTFLARSNLTWLKPMPEAHWWHSSLLGDNIFRALPIGKAASNLINSTTHSSFAYKATSVLSDLDLFIQAQQVVAITIQFQAQENSAMNLMLSATHLLTRTWNPTLWSFTCIEIKFEGNIISLPADAQDLYKECQKESCSFILYSWNGIPQMHDFVKFFDPVLKQSNAKSVYLIEVRCWPGCKLPLL